MSVKKFKFVSPGVKIQETDNSQLPRQSRQVGPVVIGRARRGPGLRPVTVDSFSEFIEVFGEPVAGGQGEDVWRNGNLTSPMYGTYAAQAWLRNATPLSYVRLMGAQHTDATTAGKAGWETKTSAGVSNDYGTTDAYGGAYGLFVIDSGSNDSLTSADPNPLTGALAAIFYINEGSIVLSGTRRDGTTTTGSTAALIKSVGGDKEFRAEIRNESGTLLKKTTFNFDINSPKYIRKVFNTNPTLCNSSVTTAANLEKYWLGPTFDRHLATYCTGSTQYGVLLALEGDTSSKSGADFRMGFQSPKTGWFFSQDIQSVSGAANSYQPEEMTKLFRLVGRDGNDWVQKNLKVSIEDIKVSNNQSDPYGSFTVVLRLASDSDNAVRIVESFTNCNLNPYSSDYIAKKIGDKYLSWSDYDRRYREVGNYDNQSKFVRVEMNSDVDAGATNPLFLPYGVYGPVRHRGFTILSASAAQTLYSSTTGNSFTQVFAQGNNEIVRSAGTADGFVDVGDGATHFTGAFLFPALQIRSSSADGNISNPQDAYFGLDNSLNSTSVRVDPGYGDYVGVLPAGYDSYDESAPDTEYSWIFTLDDLSGSGVDAVYSSGSRAAGTSFTATGSANYRTVLDHGFNRFTSPLFGGFDGLDIQEKEPFNNTDLEDGTATTNYAWNSLKRAFDCVADPEVVESNIMTVPGITNETLTDSLIKVCEDRGDSLCIVDPKGGFVPGTENTSGDSSTANRGEVSTTVTNIRNRGLNTSYACAYYPWVQIRDSESNATLWCPPSVVALGTMASSQRRTDVWFAPAGFNRGGLTEGSAGIPVVGVKEKLTSKQRDELYEAGINPIASFPAEGIVIWGQKTLQVTPSALDRINVRRLMIYVKKEISRMANSILFDPNVKITWNRFLSKVNPFLRSVQNRLGLEDFKVKLDETTTTPDLVDRNTMYARIYLKPTKAIEFIGLDFVISNSGASFDD